MTVREIVSVLSDAKEISLVWDGLATPFDTRSVVEMTAYGDFVVDSLSSLSPHKFEIKIAMRPIRKGD